MTALPIAKLIFHYENEKDAGAMINLVVGSLINFKFKMVNFNGGGSIRHTSMLIRGALH